MSRIKKNIRAAFQCCISTRHRLIGHQQRKVRQSILRCLSYSQTAGRCRCLKTNSQKNNLLFRMILSVLLCIHRGIHNSYFCALFSRTGKTHLRSRHTDQVTKCTDCHAAFQRQINGLINEANLCDTNRTSRP